MKKFTFDIQLNANDIWLYSMYNAYRGFLGVFNVLFTIACIYSLIATWNGIDMGRRLLLVLCISMFTVIQPALLYLKANKQARNEYIRAGMHMEIDDKGISVTQGEQHGEFEWNRIHKSMIKSRMVIIFLDNIRAYLIPARYWGKDESELKNMVREKTRVAKW